MPSSLVHALLNLKSNNMTSPSPRDISTVVRLPTSEVLELSPLDVTNRGRSIPMLWYYSETLDVDKLVDSLHKTLEKFPVLCGRYTHHGTAVSLNNAGVPLEVSFTKDVVTDIASHLLACMNGEEQPRVSSYNQEDLVSLLPSVRQQMNPDTANPESPLLAIKITVMSPGTVIATIVEHGIADAEAMMLFMNSWSRVFRGTMLDDPMDHDRSFGLTTVTTEEPFLDRMSVEPVDWSFMMEYAELLPRIMGNRACIVPLSQDKLIQMKESANQRLPPHRFTSTDDVITAKVWKAFLIARCNQMNIPADSEKPTILMRGLNIRSRLVPELSSTLFANGVTSVWTELTVKQVMAMTISQLALKLRTTIQKWTPGKIVALIRWMKDMQARGNKTVPTFDDNALTFVVCSNIFKNFNWEDVDFNARPLFFEQRYHVPFYCLYTPRPGHDGVNIWTSGQPDALTSFINAINDD